MTKQYECLEGEHGKDIYKVEIRVYKDGGMQVVITHSNSKDQLTIDLPFTVYDIMKLKPEAQLDSEDSTLTMSRSRYNGVIEITASAWEKQTTIWFRRYPLKTKAQLVGCPVK